jgi:hypothetical protein
MSTAETPGEALALAEEAYALVQVDPRRAGELAGRAHVAAAAERDYAAEVAALHALGWAQSVLGDPRAIETLRAAIRVGTRHGETRRVALVRRLLAVSLAFDGKTSAALREIERALAVLSGEDRARSQVHRLEIYRRARVADPEASRRALTAAAAALRLLHANGDEIWEARLRYNRGLLFLDRGESGRAEDDLRAARALYTRAGAIDAAVDAAAGLAEAARGRGDLLECLAALDEAERLQPDGRRNITVASFRPAALAEARLLPEARAAAESYIELCSDSSIPDEVPIAELDLARIALLAGDPATARDVAGRAARAFSARGKRVTAALAGVTRLHAELLDGAVKPSTVRSGLAIAAVLESGGLRRDALRARLLVARIELERGARAAAVRQLEQARPLARSGTVADRVELLHTQSLARLAAGDGAGAERLLTRGLRLLEDYRAALGAFELRATASAIGADLSHTGLRLAFGSREPEAVLVWAERLRGNALRLPLVRPPDDASLAAMQAELRHLGARARAAEERGVASGSDGRRARVEAAIRARTRLVPGEGEPVGDPPGVREAAGALGERVLVEYVELDGALAALTLREGEARLHELDGNADAALAELDWLRFALGRLARRRGSVAEHAAAAANAHASAAALESILLGPMLEIIGAAPLVIVPTGALHGVPWGVLPALRGRPVTIAPSLATWCGLAAQPPSRGRRVVLAAGPRLRHAAREVSTLAALYPGASVLTGRAATSGAALDRLDGAALAHFACHGHFRGDSPLFSALELADGPLNVYELQRLRRAPEVVVLSACDLAISGRRPGDELLGLAAALLGMGTRTIVASVVPVPDAPARRLMLAFHRALRHRHEPATALALAQAGTPVAGFLCLGRG